MFFSNALNFLNGKNRRKFANNTYFEKIDAWTIGIKVYQTYIIRIYANETIELDTGGWNTWLTRNRINRILGRLGPQNKPRVFTTNGDLFLTEGRGTRVEFFDNMILNRDGNCVNYWERR